LNSKNYVYNYLNLGGAYITQITARFQGVAKFFNANAAVKNVNQRITYKQYQIILLLFNSGQSHTRTHSF